MQHNAIIEALQEQKYYKYTTNNNYFQYDPIELKDVISLMGSNRMTLIAM
jgi:hypothetical protein